MTIAIVCVVVVFEDDDDDDDAPVPARAQLCGVGSHLSSQGDEIQVIKNQNKLLHPSLILPFPQKAAY